MEGSLAQVLVIPVALTGMGLLLSKCLMSVASAAATMTISITAPSEKVAGLAEVSLV